MENGFLEAHKRDLQQAADEFRAREEELARAEGQLRAQPSGNRHPSPDASDVVEAKRAREEAATRFANLLNRSPLSGSERCVLTGFAPAELARFRRPAG